MSGDSAHAGYLRPTSAAPLYDAEFENWLQAIFIGLTGLDETLVRPSFQEEPPDSPERDQNWLAFFVRDIDPDVNAVERHTGTGSSEMQRHQTVEVLISSYGPNACANLALLSDGLQIEQNRTVFQQNAVGLQEATRMTRAPSLAKDKWRDRWDMTLTIRRQIRRTYTIFNLASAVGVLNSEGARGLLVSNLSVTQGP